ncbi:hypothetical protein A1O3_05012 [Capronia epimyces CBS 606.96]|uniref:Heterokaryon incompatibility domain-containing protein n=1 Tax=Capronia epimyces CBS 606.96 TaxID=1182542 RepID=W9Y400_9EURO|nr:uncharacterized protein A1O3_05012 [Capronia epimyces CBS 606.96]EXJ84345.1 hypothetical protein A1O3_05012 [Capronia epimyces CBS 606.96]
MRLLNVKTYELKELKDIGPNTEYAILSHRWYTEEITFQTLSAAQLKNIEEQSPQLDKIRGACARAEEKKLDWIWIDSCCINRDSSQELQESINSMFRWYQQARVCYTYLSDVEISTPSADLFDRLETEGQRGGRPSEWFERGWTLQELLAPREMEFFDRHWQPMGTRAELTADISRITGIEARYLTGTEEFRNASIATRLSWQVGRRTSKEEDIAYSLAGLFGIQFMTSYTEGIYEAFQHLQRKIISRPSFDESLFAWTAPAGSLPPHNRSWAADQWGLLAPSIDCFEKSGDITVDGPSKRRPPSGITTTSEGVKFPMPIKDLQTTPQWPYWASIPTVIGPYMWLVVKYWRHLCRQYFPLTLNCWRKNEAGQLKAVRVFLLRDTSDLEWRRGRCAELGSANKVPSTRPYVDVLILQPAGVRDPFKPQALLLQK